MKKLFGFTCVLALLTGCDGGSGDSTEVAGVVTLDGGPLSGALVTFFPTKGTGGVGGYGATDVEGKFSITPAQATDGLPVGEYKVTVSMRKLPDGTPVPPDDETPPIESRAVETLPPSYSDMEKTTLFVKVTPETESIPIALKSRKNAR